MRKHTRATSGGGGGGGANCDIADILRAKWKKIRSSRQHAVASARRIMPTKHPETAKRPIVQPLSSPLVAKYAMQSVHTLSTHSIIMITMAQKQRMANEQLYRRAASVFSRPLRSPRIHFISIIVRRCSSFFSHSFQLFANRIPRDVISVCFGSRPFHNIMWLRALRPGFVAFPSAAACHLPACYHIVT